jgi:hypothetical protein
MQVRRKGCDPRTRVSGKLTGRAESLSRFSCGADTMRVLPRAAGAAKQREQLKCELLGGRGDREKSLRDRGYLTLRRCAFVVLRGSACVAIAEFARFGAEPPA